MKAFKLFAALLSAGVMASKGAADAADVSTVTIANPVSTRTHTSIVFVTATAGMVTNTCLATVCESDNPTNASLSTIRLTSFTTATTTTVITPPDATTTVTSDAAVSVSSSCAMRPGSTITVTVTGTSLPVITRSVYPVSASSSADETMTQVPPYQNQSTTSVSSEVVATPPYLNTSIVYTMTYTSTYTSAYSPVSSNVRGVPGIPVPMSPTASNSTYTASAGTVRPPRFLSLLAKVLSLSKIVHAQSSRVLMSEGNEPEALSDTCVLQDYTTDGCPEIQDISRDIVSRFYPYPSPLNAGPPPHITKKVRDVSDANATTTTVPGTIFITSTVVYNVTQSASVASAPSPSVIAPESPASTVSSTLLVAPVTDSPTKTSLVSAASTTATTNVALPIITPSMDSSVTTTFVDAQANNTGVQNITILVTVTAPPNTTYTSVSTTLTLISHTTETDHGHTTSTFIKTVSQTFASFTGDTAPSATGTAARLGLSVSHVAIIVTLALAFGI